MNRLRKSFNQLLDSDWLVRWSWRLATAILLLFWLGLAYAACADQTGLPLFMGKPETP